MQLKQMVSAASIAAWAVLGPIAAIAAPAGRATGLAVGPQYDTAHVYVAPEDFARFVSSITATFGGTSSKQGVSQVTPTSSQTMVQLVLTPVGSFSVFGFKTPIPYPFGAERTGYLVQNLDAAVDAARADGADIVVAPFRDAIGRDAIIQWPGGVYMQLYWHTVAPSYGSLESIPENRVYVSTDKATSFVERFVHFSHGVVLSSVANAPGLEIGRPGDRYRNVRIQSPYGKMSVIATDGHVPWPYGRETTGYETKDLAATLVRATAAGATVLVAPFSSRGRQSAMVEFPGGYIAEIHAVNDGTP
jgi:hypothetical protein